MWLNQYWRKKPAVLAGIALTLMFAGILNAQPPEQPPVFPDELHRLLKDKPGVLNPYCKPKLQVLKREIKEQKQLLRQTRAEAEQREGIKRLYALHEDLRRTRGECLSSRPSHEVDEGVED